MERQTPPLPSRAPRARVTRKDVARYAGVSTAVISYVINDGPQAVAPATRERVLEAIRVLGYRPNAAARALKLGATELLGLVIPDNTNLYFAELSRAIEEVAYEKGFALLVSSSARAQSQERRLIRNLISRQVDGLLLLSIESSPDLTSVTEANIPVVLLGRRKGLEGVVAVGVDHRAGARMGVQHLIEHGHSRIGLVAGEDAADDRERGWLDALESAGLPEGPVVRVPFSREGGYEAGKRLLNRTELPTAIFVSSDMQAVGVLLALHEAGIQIPRDMALVSFDGSAESEFSWPPLTVIRQPIQEIARAAVETVIGTTGDPHEDYLTFPAELIIRGSCGCETTPPAG